MNRKMNPGGRDVAMIDMIIKHTTNCVAIKPIARYTHRARNIPRNWKNRNMIIIR